MHTPATSKSRRTPSTPSFSDVAAAIKALPTNQRPAAKDAASKAFGEASPRLSASERAVAEFIARDIYWRDGYCEAACKKLQQGTGFSRRQIFRAQSSLVKRGLIVVRATRDAHGLNKPNQFSVPAMAAYKLHGVVTCASPPSAAADTRGSDTGDTRVVTAVSPLIDPLVIPLEGSRAQGALANGEAVASQGISNERKSRSNAADFEAFWQAYPRRVGKSEAAKAFAKLALAEREQAINGAAQFARQVKSERTEEKFIQYPSRFINTRRFEDFTETVAATSMPAPEFDRATLIQLAQRYDRGLQWEAAHGPEPGHPDSIITAEILEAARQAQSKEIANATPRGN